MLSAQHTEIRIISIMGGADVYVPEGLDVQVSQFALMGGNDVRLGRGRPAPGGPTVHLRLFSLMGGSDVKRGRKLTRRERRELKEQRRAQRRIDRGDRAAERYCTRFGFVAEASMSRGAAEPSAGTSITSSPTP